MAATAHRASVHAYRLIAKSDRWNFSARTIDRQGFESLLDVGQAVDEHSVRDLVEPLITTVPEGPPEYVATAGQTLARQGNVTIVSVESLRVVANVVDGDEAHDVELSSTAEGLLALCNCTIGHSGHLCPHSFATAFVVWNSG
jgi:hypothetical protein